MTTFRWFGGQAIDGTALPVLGVGSVEEQLKTLVFLAST